MLGVEHSEDAEDLGDDRGEMFLHCFSSVFIEPKPSKTQNLLSPYSLFELSRIYWT